MKRIQTNPTALYANTAKFQQAADRLRQMEQELFHSYVSMDLEVRSKPELGERVYAAIREMQSLAGQLEQMGVFMKTVAARLEDADRQAGAGIEKISSQIQAIKSISANPVQGMNTSLLA